MEGPIFQDPGTRLLIEEDIYIGDNVEIQCKVENHIYWENVYNGSFSWKKNAKDIPIDPRYVTVGNALIINNLSKNDEGNISVKCLM